ncbi:molybdenum cofactor guanylyltransferase [Paenibacillus whitsoniae]|uniref:Probable molybdenum cofactor guanylyltransferase n=1 Tax=Paenibacillus whitsoniae TaxID=2496558 RepID=A0A3S0AEV1_9BACL|nr:molybdenum cofactor guanylyltransferase [Paenibacillus whitsoniae]RTE11311.1 molybdenum cofactor guanylyltransferase [Paenibacillus whitsoniae]
MKLTGVILAGGLNSRMGGSPKYLLPCGDEPLIGRQIKEMSRICEQLLVVTNTPERMAPVLKPYPGVSCIQDRYRQKGPLSGIHAASCAAASPFMWIVGCDMPRISADAAEAMAGHGLAENADAVIPVIAGRTHPLHGIYARSVNSAAENLLRQERYRVMGLLDALDCRRVDELFFEEKGIPTGFAANVNTPEDWIDMLGNMP